MRWCIDRKQVRYLTGWLLVLGILWVALPAWADAELDAQVEKTLLELDQPWIGGCNALAAGVERKILLLTGILYQGMEDPERSRQLEEEFLRQYESLDEERRYLFAPVLSYRARREYQDTPWAVTLWRRSVRLLDRAELPADCPDSLLQNWKQRVGQEGVLVMTWAGLQDDDAALLHEAAKLAEDLGRPDLAPLKDDPKADLRARVLHHEPPVYPEEARRKGVRGEVMLKLFISEYGAVIDAQVQQGIDPLLDASAVEAALKCRFAPARRGGMPAKTYVVVPYSFLPE